MVPHYSMKEVPVCLPRCLCHHKPGCDGDCGNDCGDSPPCGKVRCKRVLYKRLVPQETEVLRCQPREIPPAPPCEVLACPAPCAGPAPAGVPATSPPLPPAAPAPGSYAPTPPRMSPAQ